MPKQTVREIVVTGGPCGGKSTGMVALLARLAERGWRVLVVPEAATMYLTGGVGDLGRLATQERARFIAFQQTLIGTQRALRRQYQRMAEALGDERTVILYDRGEMDSAAYVAPEEFEEILRREGLTAHEIRDSYTGVVHLVTAADGAEESYTTANNAARLETPEQARELDRMTLTAWSGHQRLKVVDNSSRFEEKIDRLVQAVLALLGEQPSAERQRKLLLRGPAPAEALEALEAVRFEIEQRYLPRSGDTQVRIRRQEQNGAVTCSRTRRRSLPDGTRVEDSELISEETYAALSEVADPERATIRKTRWAFTWNKVRMVVDELVEPGSVTLCEVDAPDRWDGALPDGLEVERDVTDEPRWSNARIARSGVPE